MHTLIHRALSPQTISYAWLVLTVALTFALAVAQSAIAAAPSLSAAGPAGAPRRPRRPGPGARCRPVPRRGPGRGPPGRRLPVGAERACRALGASAGPPVAGAGILAPSTPRRGADALAALYGGAGPHGPPASAGFQTNVPVRSTPSRDRSRPRLQPEPCPLGCLRAFRARRRDLRFAHARHRDAGMSRTPSIGPSPTARAPPGAASRPLAAAPRAPPAATPVPSEGRTGRWWYRDAERPPPAWRATPRCPVTTTGGAAWTAAPPIVFPPAAARAARAPSGIHGSPVPGPGSRRSRRRT